MKKKLRVIELFAGIGAPRKALMRGRYNFEIVDAIEIDKYAVKSYNAMYGENIEIKNICEYFPKKEDVGEIDLLFHGSPCQDFSLAGKQAGGNKDSGTRSSLMYETIRIVEELKPKYVVWENVKNLLSKKHRHNFDAYLETMTQLGYINYYQVLNAKDYGIPQNRERVFTISILDNHTKKDENNSLIVKDFKFSLKQDLQLRLKDMLEDKVDEKYYLSEQQIENIKKSNFTQNQRRIQEKEYCDTLCARDWKDPKCVQVATLPYFSYESDGRVYSPSGISPCLRAKEPNQKIDERDSILIKNATKKGYLEAYPGDGVYTNTSTKRGTVQPQTIQTLTTFQDKGVVMNDLRIRKLTPRETFRLMGFDDSDFEKASQENSNTQLYKQAGNSIVVNVIEAIFDNLLKDYQ